MCLVDIDLFKKFICSVEPFEWDDECHEVHSTFAYVMLVLVGAILLALQAMFVNLFKVYRKELAN